ncbi:hypothetical protein GGI06_001297 [Coemansia sp. S85]|nr:hypothetical protein GGI06_001297 [Coemansia sp. S85]
MSMSSVVGGSSLRLLTEYLGDCRFPIANKLYVTINGYHTEARESREVAIANINAFSLFLRSLVPADVAVKLACVSEDEFMAINESTVGMMYEEYFEVFAGSLYAGAREAMLNLNDIKLSHLSSIDAIPMLSRLELDCLLSSKAHTALVVKASPVLQYLSIGIRNASALLQDDDGRDVTYLNLQYLQMHFCDRSYPEVDQTINDFVAFPVLKHLTLASVYPFADDVLFRGNSATLEYLNIPMNWGVISMLHKKGVFECDRKALKAAIVREADDHEDISRVSDTTMSKFLHCFACHAQYLSLPPSLLNYISITESRHKNSFKNVQVLNMVSRVLSFYEILCLLETFPVLTKLQCGIAGLGPEFQHLSDEEVPDHIVANYGNTGKNLVIWCMNGYGEQSSKRLLEYTMLLALVCPRFCRADVYLGMIPDYNKCLAAALKSGPYSKYALQLSRLITRKH